MFIRINVTLTIKTKQNSAVAVCRWLNSDSSSARFTHLLTRILKTRGSIVFRKAPNRPAATQFHSPQDSFIHNTPVFLHLSEDCCSQNNLLFRQPELMGCGNSASAGIAARPAVLSNDVNM